MNKKFTREEVVERLKQSVKTKKSVLLASAGMVLQQNYWKREA
ncbi:MAG: hypothetical protein U5N58_13340 [Actinomycetota bacterium]|nr:hypothetical protein [Actinomycetota bacterium]